MLYPESWTVLGCRWQKDQCGAGVICKSLVLLKTAIYIITLKPTHSHLHMVPHITYKNTCLHQPSPHRSPFSVRFPLIPALIIRHKKVGKWNYFRQIPDFKLNEANVGRLKSNRSELGQILLVLICSRLVVSPLPPYQEDRMILGRGKEMQWTLFMDN